MTGAKTHFERRGKMWEEFSSRVSVVDTKSQSAFDMDGSIHRDVASDVLEVIGTIEEPLRDEKQIPNAVKGGEARDVLKKEAGKYLAFHYESNEFDVLDSRDALSVRNQLEDHKDILSLETDDVEDVLDRNDNLSQLEASDISGKKLDEFEEKIIRDAPWYYNKYLCKILYKDNGKEAVLDKYIATCKQIVSDGKNGTLGIIREIMEDADDEKIESLNEDRRNDRSDAITQNSEESSVDKSNDGYEDLYYKAKGRLEEMSVDSLFSEIQSINEKELSVDEAEKIQLARSYMKNNEHKIKQGLNELIEEHDINDLKKYSKKVLDSVGDARRNTNKSYLEDTIKTIDFGGGSIVINTFFLASTPVFIVATIVYVLWLVLSHAPAYM